MKSIKLVLSLLIVGGFSLNAQETNWNFDASHSKIAFAVSHMVISETEGQFNSYNGSVTTNGEEFENAKIQFTIDVASVDTDDEGRDEHLRAPDFFNVEKHPNISFESTSMKKIDGKNYKLMGNMTLMGVTKPITLDVIYGGMVNDPWGNTRAGFKLKGSINRNDFGLKYNSRLDSGGLMIGEEVELKCNVELVKKA